MGVPAFAPDTPTLLTCQTVRSFQQENNRSHLESSPTQFAALLPLYPHTGNIFYCDRKRYKLAQRSTPNVQKSHAYRHFTTLLFLNQYIVDCSL